MKEQDLKEKIQDTLYNSNVHCGGTYQCVQIAKDYAEQEAIEFSEWMHEKAGYAGNGHYAVIGHTGYHSIPKLYQLFKNRENER